MSSVTNLGDDTGETGDLESIPVTNADDAPTLHECGCYDVEQVGKVANLLLIALGTACVEKTAGDPFSHPAAVVEDVKKDMLEYLNVQSDAIANGTSAEIFQSSGAIPSPSKFVQDLVENFVRSKKNLFSRVSSKILYSDRREDKIEDFVQELERSGAWMVGQREILAKALLKRVDYHKVFSCEKRFETYEMLAEHKSECALRAVTCANEGCNSVYSAFQSKPHDSSCKYKLMICELGCKRMVARGDMDKHCLTVCPMKLVNCPFAQVGCTPSIPQGMQEQHCVDHTGHHLLLVCQNLQRQGVCVGNQGQRIALLEKEIQMSQRAEAVDVGTLLLTVREQDVRLKSLEQEVVKLRQELKSSHVSTELQQLRRELRTVQNRLESADVSGASGAL